MADMDILDWIADSIWWLAALALTSLTFAGLGYYTASTDLEEEKRKAWDKGYHAEDLAQNPYTEGARR